MTKPKTTPEPIAAPAEDTPPATEGGEKTAAISSDQADFEIVYADWSGTTPDQVAGLRLMNGSYNNPKVAHCWHFYQLGSGGLK